MKKSKKILIYMLPLIISVSIYALAKIYLRYIASLNIPCLIHLFTGYWCPGCGGTRSVSALLSGDIIGSVRYNPFVIILIIFGIMLYIRLILKINGRVKTVFPENDNYIIIAVIIMVIYYTARNFIPFLMPKE